MHVKRIYASSVREALSSAREQLGESALVLSTELVPSPGWRGWVGQRVVRLTAAAERPEPGSPEAWSDAFASSPKPQAPSPRLSVDRPAIAVPDGRPSRPDPRAGLIARLAAAGLSGSLAEAVAAEMSDAECRTGTDEALRRALGTVIAPIAGGSEPFTRYEVFVGPPGVGKTTTIAKIAAQACANHGLRLNLVAADGFRAGAIEQLRSYATIVGAPFRVARSADELDRALTGTRQTALIDTAGHTIPDAGMIELVEVLGRKRGARTHLVLAADTSAATARRLLDRYARIAPARVVITKLDEADSVMPLVDAVRERGLVVSYLTTGQRVPEDLERATPASLAARLLGEPSLENLQQITAEGMTCH
jgi:flagellar biosynthesis protein FlhF